MEAIVQRRFMPIDELSVEPDGFLAVSGTIE